MSRKPSFANLRTPSVALTQTAEGNPTPVVARPVSREGRKQIAGFFTPDMSFAMHTLARRQNKSLQALMAESFNDVLRKYGESPIGD
jgi:hypothetical protein